jgi:hypothetical protein
VSSVSLSRDGRWNGIRGTPNDRYKRNVTESGIYGDAYLLETATGRIERLTSNAETGESPVSFSPDGSLLAISAPNDWTYFRDSKIWVRATAGAGAAWRKLGDVRRGPQRGLVVRRRETIYTSTASRAPPRSSPCPWKAGRSVASRTFTAPCS